MKTLIICIVFLATLGLYSFVAAADMRQDHQAFEQKMLSLIQKAKAEKQAAAAEKKAIEKEIKNDKEALQTAITKFKSGIKQLTKQNKELETEVKKLGDEQETLRADLDEISAINREFEGLARTNAKELKSMLVQSIQSGLAPDRHKFLEPVIQQHAFPTMEDVRNMARSLFEEIRLNGQVNVTSGMIVDRKGKEQTADLLILGNFTAIYRLNNEIGFLLYSDESRRYFALSKLPATLIRNNIRSYLTGKIDRVFMDISKGGAVRQLAHQLNLAEQIPKGGAIVWPILVLFGVAVLIVIERILFFSRRRVNTEKLMEKLRQFVISGDWDGCREYLKSKQGKLVPKVLLTALALKDKTRPEMENALQEAILGEIPAIERFISALGMLAAIAPLLGLLGTVTGMINTFHVITYYGTGDPRMMSGGISEALVTTMLGLSVAIPIMLAHTFLSRRVETLISVMEEKSVAFVNMVFKSWAERH